MFPEELFPSMKTAGGNAERSPERAGKIQKVEVSYEQLEGGEGVALRYLTWTDGLGWCCQKTIRVEGEQLDELHRALTVARQRFRRRRAEAGEPSQPAHVIPFPTLS